MPRRSPSNASSPTCAPDTHPALAKFAPFRFESEIGFESSRFSTCRTLLGPYRCAPKSAGTPTCNLGRPRTKRMMIVAFESKQLRTICEDPDVAVTRLGQEIAHRLRGRVADIRAATNVSDLLVGNPRLQGSSLELLVVDLGDEARMVWKANHVSPRTLPDGNTDWSQVSRVKLLKIEEASA